MKSLLQTVVCVLAAYSAIGRPSVASAACLEPDNLEEEMTRLRRQLQEDYFVEMPQFVNPDYLHEAYAHLRSQNHHLPELNASATIGRHHFITGESKCRKARRKAKTVCPSYYILEHDPNRIPTSIAKARCSCAKCCDGGCELGKNCKMCRLESWCEEVNSYIPVIRRRCVGGRYKYYNYIEPVAVGCTCRNRDNLDD